MKLDTDKIKKIAKASQNLGTYLGAPDYNMQVWVNTATGGVEYEEFIDCNSYVKLSGSNINIGYFFTPIDAQKLKERIENTLYATILKSETIKKVLKAASNKQEAINSLAALVKENAYPISEETDYIPAGGYIYDLYQCGFYNFYGVY